MAKPKIQLSDALQETIAFNQEDNCDAAKERVGMLDKWISSIIVGNPIEPDTLENRIEMLQILDVMKRDYKSFIIE